MVLLPNNQTTTLFQNYDVKEVVELPAGTEMVMPGTTSL